MPMNNRLLRPTTGLDPDAAKYLAAVEAADGEPLEPAVRTAINAFIKGLKADSLWDAIGSSCLLCGPRTLAGALVPLRGDAPTAYSFTDGDHSRTAGLTGDGSTTYLDSGRANDDDPQDDNHLAVYITEAVSSDEVFAGALSTSNFCGRQLNWRSSNNVRGFANSISFLQSAVYSGSESLVGVTRENSSQQSLRVDGTTTTGDVDSADLPQENVYVFARNDDDAANVFSDATIAFYSSGTSLDLAKLDSHITAYVTAIGAAI